MVDTLAGYAVAALGAWLMVGFALWMMNSDQAPETDGEFDSARRKMMRDNLGGCRWHRMN